MQKGVANENFLAKLSCIEYCEPKQLPPKIYSLFRLVNNLQVWLFLFGCYVTEEKSTNVLMVIAQPE